MIDNYEHYITKNIKAFYKRRLFSPIVYLVLLVILWFAFSLGSILMPPKLKNDTSLEDYYNSSTRYASVTLKDLHFTGYTSNRGKTITGYYYYCLRGDQCSIILLSPSSCQSGLPDIDKLSVVGKVLKGKSSYNSMIKKLASDLDWTSQGMLSQVSDYYFSEPAFNMTATIITFVFYFGSMAYALCCLILYLVFIAFPVMSPTCQNLLVFGNPRLMLEEAEEELATLPQLATEDMFITEHYFIQTSPYGNHIIPINEILWIYKHSTLHKLLWYHFSISYTLHITANKHLYVKCPKNAKSDIDGIMDYLAEANHHILVGFSEENRIKVQEQQGAPFHIEKILAFHEKRKQNK